MTTATRSLPVTLATGRLVPLGAALFLGLFITGFTGFAPIDAVHNAAHDYRHSMGFPCH